MTVEEFRDYLCDFIEKKLGGEIFYKTDREIRFIAEELPYKPPLNEDQQFDLVMDIMQKFTEYKIDNPHEEAAQIFTVEVLDNLQVLTLAFKF